MRLFSFTFGLLLASQVHAIPSGTADSSPSTWPARESTPLAKRNLGDMFNFKWWKDRFPAAVNKNKDGRVGSRHPEVPDGQIHRYVREFSYESKENQCWKDAIKGTEHADVGERYLGLPNPEEGMVGSVDAEFKRYRKLGEFADEEQKRVANGEPAQGEIREEIGQLLNDQKKLAGQVADARRNKGKGKQDRMQFSMPQNPGDVRRGFQSLQRTAERKLPAAWSAAVQNVDNQGKKRCDEGEDAGTGTVMRTWIVAKDAVSHARDRPKQHYVRGSNECRPVMDENVKMAEREAGRSTRWNINWNG
ncbi:MAG: hypothetical protein M1823_000098 [Watsoniomyces obsoletus]|nr:MAG: hypothetical protein M1823_000098 [Watsoniomyces obsoletus]